MDKKVLVDIQVILDILDLFSPSITSVQSFVDGYNECKQRVTSIIQSMKGEN